MEKNLSQQFNLELDRAKDLYFSQKHKESFRHLERAHILGQRFVYAHTITHLWMLRLYFLNKDFKGVCGQLIRIPVGIVGSFIGLFPKGNTGGSNVPMMKVMNVPEDLKRYL